MDSSTQEIHAPKIEQAKKNVPEAENCELDDALEDTFPASDPPSMTEPHRHLGSGKKSHEPQPGATPDVTEQAPEPAKDK